jgi:hypothetical protein
LAARGARAAVSDAGDRVSQPQWCKAMKKVMKKIRIMSAPIPPLGPKITTIILENLGIVMTYAFSVIALDKYYNEEFEGTSKAIEQACFDLPEQGATRALVELAVLFRALDDTRQLAKSIKGDFGLLVGNNERTEGPLSVREAMNKIIHAEAIFWNCPDNVPTVVCCASASQASRFGWSRAIIPVEKIALACSGFDVQPIRRFRHGVITDSAVT